MYQFKVEGLHCGSCVDGLDEELKRYDKKGVVEADLDKEELTVRTTASLETIKKTIEEAGYKILRYQSIA